MDNEWKKQLRDRFSDYSEPEPEGLWEAVEQGMAGKSRRKMLPVWFISGLAAAAAVALVVFPFREKTKDVTPDLRTADSIVEETVAEPVPVEEPVPAPIAVVSRRTLLAEVTPAEPVSIPEDRIPDAVHEVIPSSEEAESVPDAPTLEPEETPEQAASPEILVPDSPVRQAETRPARKRFSISAYGYGGQASSEQVQGYGMNRTGEYLTRATFDGPQRDVGGMARMLTANRASDFEVHHSAPLRAGITAAWGLTEHLNLVSGLNWTYLNSDFVETAGTIRTVSAQELGYLGIPLRLEAGVQVWKGLWLYAGAGGMVEKGLMSSSWTKTLIDGQLAQSEKNPSPDMGGLLWSLGATAGMELRYGRFLGLYCSPGIEYHFDNGSDLRSSYSEKPLHWSVNIGVRFHFGND